MCRARQGRCKRARTLHVAREIADPAHAARTVVNARPCLAHIIRATKGDFGFLFGLGRSAVELFEHEDRWVGDSVEVSAIGFSRLHQESGVVGQGVASVGDD